jgi:hypothetical protein
VLIQKDHLKAIAIVISVVVKTWLKFPHSVMAAPKSGQFYQDIKPLTNFANNRERIEHAARKKYMLGLIESDGLVLLKPEDL